MLILVKSGTKTNGQQYHAEGGGTPGQESKDLLPHLYVLMLLGRMGPIRVPVTMAGTGEAAGYRQRGVPHAGLKDLEDCGPGQFSDSPSIPSARQHYHHPLHTCGISTRKQAFFCLFVKILYSCLTEQK